MRNDGYVFHREPSLSISDVPNNDYLNKNLVEISPDAVPPTPTPASVNQSLFSPNLPPQTTLYTGLVLAEAFYDCGVSSADDFVREVKKQLQNYRKVLRND
jgi:hypothetical protein